MRNALLFVTAVLLVAGCGDKKPKKATPGSGTAVAAPADAAANTPKQNVLKIPKLAGTPPVKTTKPIDKAKAEELAKADFEGFSKDVRLATDEGLDVRYKTEEKPIIMVTIQAQRCFDCIPMELDKWKAKIDSLKVLVGPELKDHPDTQFEMGMTEIAGAPYVWTYHVGYNISKDPATGMGGSYGTAYAIHYNDGVNMIRVVADYKDDVPQSREDMVNLTPREDLELIAKAFIDHFVHAW